MADEYDDNDYDNPGSQFDTSDWPESDAGYVRGGCLGTLLIMAFPVVYALYKILL